jgi:ubiquinone/menaquinone biosynthesis C-methylase UbiE
MKWFRKIFSSPGSEPRARPVPARGASRQRVTPEREPDWRSYDWNDVAADYARVVAPMTMEPARDVLALAELPAGGRLLDVGAGTGIEILEVDGFGIGVDVSQKMLLEGRKISGRTALVAADVIDMPFRDASFDVVMANFVLPYVTKLDTALFDMLRVLKPGGRLAVTVWTEVLDDLTRRWRGLATEVLGPELLRDALKQGTPWAERTADARHLEQVLRDAGLRPVRVQKRRYRNELSRDDYVVGKEVEVIGRYLHRMLGEERWASFRERARARFAEQLGGRVVDFRDVLLAVGTKP